MQKSATKLVRVNLSALTRVEYTEVLEVPASFTEADIEEMIDERWDAVDGSSFQEDPSYWEKGECTAEAITRADTMLKEFVSVERNESDEIIFGDDHHHHRW